MWSRLLAARGISFRCHVFWPVHKHWSRKRLVFSVYGGSWSGDVPDRQSLVVGKTGLDSDFCLVSIPSDASEQIMLYSSCKGLPLAHQLRYRTIQYIYKTRDCYIELQLRLPPACRLGYIVCILYLQLYANIGRERSHSQSNGHSLLSEHDRVW